MWLLSLSRSLSSYLTAVEGAGSASLTVLRTLLMWRWVIRMSLERSLSRKSASPGFPLLQ